MASINLTLKTKLSWWVKPMLYVAVAWCWIARRDQIAPAFIDWIVRHGLKIEVE